MSSDRYPILVERMAPEQALVIVCELCHAETTITEDRINNEMNYDCPKECGGWATFKFEEADKCPNCGVLGFFPSAYDRCCSRPCQLQLEYQADLASRRQSEESGFERFVAQQERDPAFKSELDAARARAAAAARHDRFIRVAAQLERYGAEYEETPWWRLRRRAQLRAWMRGLKALGEYFMGPGQ